MKCDRDCFNCKFDDCINDKISDVEKLESNFRDIVANATELINATGSGRKKARRRNYIDYDFPNM